MTQAGSGIAGGFPRLDPSARGTALGGNMAAVAAGGEALLWNPAGLLSLSAREAAFTYSDLYNLGLVTQTVVQFGWPRLGHKIDWDGGRFRKVPLPPPANSAFGLSFSSLRAEVGDGAYHEAQIGLAYAWRLPVGLLAGTDLRFLSAGSPFATTGGSGHALDFGLQRPLGAFRLGLAATDLISTVNWDEEGGTHSLEEDAPLPVRWSLGLAWTSVAWRLLATAQSDWQGSGLTHRQTGTGVEWWPHSLLVLRGAFRHRQDALGTRREWSAGAGFKVGQVQVDYGWQQSARDLGPTHRWSAAVGL
jgi:hypothetical protein